MLAMGDVGGVVVADPTVVVVFAVQQKPCKGDLWTIVAHL